MILSVNNLCSLRISLHVRLKRKAGFLFFVILSTSTYAFYMHSWHLQYKTYTVVDQCYTRWYSKSHRMRWESSGRWITPSQIVLPGYIQHSQETDIHGLMSFEPVLLANEMPQNHVLNHVAFDIGWLSTISLITRLKDDIFYNSISVFSSQTCEDIECLKYRVRIL